MPDEPHSSRFFTREPPAFDATPEIAGFTTERLLGRGGSGEAWLVRQSRPFERQLVAKVFRPQPDAASMLARFERERGAISALTASGAGDPGLAAIHDAGLTGDGRPYVLMQFIDGQPIDAASRALGLDARIGLVRQCCTALVHAHEASLVHQDITPGNILVSRRRDGSDHVTIIDFGLAASAGSRAVLQGTPDWMAPEQSRLDGTGVSPATDVWAIGRLLRTLADGRKGDDTRLTAEMRALADRCMRIDPRERPADAAVLLVEIDAARARAARSRRMRWLTAAAAALPLIAGVAVAIGALTKPRWRDVPGDAVDLVARDFDKAAGLALPDGWEPRNRGVGRWALGRPRDADIRVLVGEGTDGAHAQVAIPLGAPVALQDPFWLEWTMRVRPPVESSGRRDESDLLVILVGAQRQLAFQPQLDSLVISRSAGGDPAIPAAREGIPGLGFARHDAWVRYRVSRSPGPEARFTVERTDLASGESATALIALPPDTVDHAAEVLLAVQERQPLEISGIRLSQRPQGRAP